MDDKIFFLASSINESLKIDPRVKKLQELENKLNDSYDVFLLSNKKDEALEKYTRLKELYSDDHIEVVSALKELKSAKEELNNHPLVKEYLKVYSEVRDLYLEIDNILLSDYRGGTC